MSKRFRREDREAVPNGWKVRTVKAGSHRVRVAFPPGRRQKGSGKLVSVLHPIGENAPCELRSSNPAELMVMSANNPPRSRGEEAKKRRQEEKMRRLILKAADRMEKAGFKELAKKQREFAARGNPAELMIMGANPRVEVVHGNNPPVEDITEEFTGTEVKWIDVYNEPHIPRGRYAYLAKLLSLHIKPAKGGQVQRISFGEGDGAPLIVSDSSAKQVYFVGGNQDITAALEAFGATEPNQAGLVELGQGRRIDYQGRKEHVADPDEDKWKHAHGEENGALPVVLFDTRNKRILYEGGDYRIEGPWIKN
jgi:hypothetical protein